MKTNVTFLSNGLELVGQLYLPDDYTGDRRPAVVVYHPFGGVKEQTAGLYAERLADEGFVALAFDGATHIDLYDKEEYVPTALTKLTSFFGEHLTGRPAPTHASVDRRYRGPPRDVARVACQVALLRPHFRSWSAGGTCRAAPASVGAAFVTSPGRRVARWVPEVSRRMPEVLLGLDWAMREAGQRHHRPLPNPQQPLPRGVNLRRPWSCVPSASP